jgi:GAF domain-containing protein
MQKFGHFRIPSDYGIPGAVRKRGGTMFFGNQAQLKALIADQHKRVAQPGGVTAHKMEKYEIEYHGLWNGMGVPMIDANGRIVGVLEIGNKVGRTDFTPQDERLIRVIL